MKNLVEIFSEAAAVPDIGVYFRALKDERFFSYKELYEQAELVSGGLLEKGLQPGESVALMFPTGPDFFRSFFGVLLAGGVPCALYPPVRLGRMDEWKAMIDRQLELLESRFVIADQRLSGVIQSASKTNTVEVLSIEKLSRSGERKTNIQGKEEDLAFIQFSSGTTSWPKPVMITHANVYANATAILQKIPPQNPADKRVCVSWLPLYHDMGLVGCLVCSMLDRSEMILIRPEHFIARPALWLNAISEACNIGAKEVVSVAPNFAYGLCAKKIKERDLEGMDLRHWYTALCGAEAVNPETLKSFARRFKDVGFDEKALTPVYGMAEATLAVTFSDLKVAPKYRSFDQEKLQESGVVQEADEGLSVASVGQPLDGMEVEIRDESNQGLKDGQVGTVYVRGPSIMRGYRRENSATIKEDGWFNTGDTGFFFKEELFLCGRKKDVLILRGRNIDPSFVESSLDACGFTRTGCSIAVSDRLKEQDSESLFIMTEAMDQKTWKALIADQESYEKSLLEVKALIKKHHQLTVEEVAIFPPGTLLRTSSGKIRRQKTYQAWRRGELFHNEEMNSWQRFSVFASESLKGYLRGALQSRK